MRTLILYLEDNEKFDAVKLLNDLQSIKGTFDINGKNFAESTVACEFEYDGDLATLRLEGEPNALSIEGIGKAGLKLAWELQAGDKRAFRVTDGDYAFDFSLRNVQSLEELKKMIYERYYDSVAQEKTDVVETAQAA